MKDPQEKAELYACLWMMMNEETPEKFKEREELFVSYWIEKQPTFIAPDKVNSVLMC